MANNAFVNIFRIKDLRQRILFTFGMLLVFRLGTVLPIPGIDVNALQLYFNSQGTGGGVGITDYINFFSGGAFKNFSIFMLGIMPYITTSIIMNLLVMVFPTLRRIQEEDGGRKKIQRYTRYGTIVMTLIQSYMVTYYAKNIPNAIVMDNFMLYTVIAMLTVTTGTIFLMWIGEQITQRGVGNGITLLIFAGIVARMPDAFITLVKEVQAKRINPVFVIVVIVMFVVVVALVIYEQQGQRKIPVHYSKRVVGRRMYGAQNTYLPFKINPSGVIPVIFASSILSFPMQIAQSLGANFAWLNAVQRALAPTSPIYLTVYTILIIFFAYFYTQVSLNPSEIAKQIRENGGSVPGIRTEKIEEHLTKILNRIILPGALFLAFIALIPSLVQMIFNIPASVSMIFGGTSLIIMVGADLDTISQIEGHMRMHHQDGIVKKGKIRSRTL